MEQAEDSSAYLYLNSRETCGHILWKKVENQDLIKINA
jgi:hypothetical protein